MYVISNSLNANRLLTVYYLNARFTHSIQIKTIKLDHFSPCSNTTPCIEILDIRYDKLHCSKILQVSHMPHGYLSD